MDIAGAAKSIGNSIIGNISKAMLIVNTGGVGHAALDAMVSVLTNKNNQTTIALDAKALAPMLDVATTAAKAKSMDPDHTEGTLHMMEVQFNPSTVSLDAYADATPFKGLMSGLDTNVINQQIRAASIVMSCDLIFDAVQNADAFRQDSLTLSASNLVSTGAGLASKIMSGDDDKYSVLKPTQGLLSLLLNQSGTHIIFHYGEFAFAGILKGVQVNYSMFSPVGCPIRSKVSLRIEQVIEDVNMLKVWDGKYDAVFGDSPAAKKLREKIGKDASALGQAGQAASRILGI
jgi:hypothetical protein